MRTVGLLHPVTTPSTPLAHTFVILRLSTMFLYPTARDGITEAKVRFTVVDAIIKGIRRCTQTMVTAEVSVQNLEKEDISTCPPNPTEMPQQQKTLSCDIGPDYTFYSLSNTISKALVCTLVEVKKRKLFKDHALCQTIVYQLSLRVTVKGTYNKSQTDMYKFSYLPNRCSGGTTSTIGDSLL